MRRLFLIAGTTCIVLLFVFSAGVLYYPRYKMAEAIEGVRERAGDTNRFFFERLPDASWRTIVKPSPDLAYGAMAYDLSDGPVIIDVPGHDDYWSLQFVDDTTDSFAYAGSRTHGKKPVRIVLSGADSKAPEGEVVRSPSVHGIAVIRYLVRDASAFERIDRLRRRVSVY